MVRRPVRTLLPAVALAALLGGCATLGDMVGLSDEDPLIFLEQEAPAVVVMEALYEGRISVDEAGCVRLLGGASSTVVWPYGFRLDNSGPGVHVRDAEGRVVGRLGGSFRLGGGHVPTLHEGLQVGEPARSRALDRCPGAFWVVGEVAGR